MNPVLNQVSCRKSIKNCSKHSRACQTEPEEFTLKFSVPVNGAHEFLQIDSGATWGEVQKQLADVLEVPPKAVCVAYHFSTEPRNAPYKHLNKPAHLIELVESAQHAMSTTKSKKEFIVELKDISGAVDKGKASKRGSKGKHVKVSQSARLQSSVSLNRDKRQSKRGINTDNDLSDSDASDDIDNRRVKSVRNRSGPQWVAQLEKDNACHDHPGKSCIKRVNGHQALSRSDLAAWAIYLVLVYRPRQLYKLTCYFVNDSKGRTNQQPNHLRSSS